MNDSSDSGKSITHREWLSIPSAPADRELIAQLKTKLQYAELRIRVLEERLRLMRIEKYGTGGEKLPQAQMQLFDLAPVVSEMIEQADPEQAPVRRPTKGSGKHPNRQELPTPISGSGAFRNLLQLRGSPAIHRLKRPGHWRLQPDRGHLEVIPSCLPTIQELADLPIGRTRTSQ